MEKRRRARINDSLGQLKSLILEATNKDVSLFFMSLCFRTTTIQPFLYYLPLKIGVLKFTCI